MPSVQTAAVDRLFETCLHSTLSSAFIPSSSCQKKSIIFSHVLAAECMLVIGWIDGGWMDGWWRSNDNNKTNDIYSNDINNE